MTTKKHPAPKSHATHATNRRLLAPTHPLPQPLTAELTAFNVAHLLDKGTKCVEAGRRLLPLANEFQELAKMSGDEAKPETIAKIRDLVARVTVALDELDVLL